MSEFPGPFGVVLTLGLFLVHGTLSPLSGCHQAVLSGFSCLATSVVSGWSLGLVGPVKVGMVVSWWPSSHSGFELVDY